MDATDIGAASASEVGVPDGHKENPYPCSFVLMVPQHVDLLTRQDCWKCDSSELADRSRMAWCLEQCWRDAHADCALGSDAASLLRMGRAQQPTDIAADAP